jgi:hypothetical protein
LPLRYEEHKSPSVFDHGILFCFFSTGLMIHELCGAYFNIFWLEKTSRKIAYFLHRACLVSLSLQLPPVYEASTGLADRETASVSTWDTEPSHSSWAEAICNPSHLHMQQPSSVVLREKMWAIQPLGNHLKDALGCQWGGYDQHGMHPLYFCWEQIFMTKEVSHIALTTHSHPLPPQPSHTQVCRQLKSWPGEAMSSHHLLCHWVTI